MPASVLRYAVCLFFLLMLVIPTTYQLPRGGLLAVILSTGLIGAVNGHWRVHRDIFMLALIMLLVSLTGIIKGMMAGGPGALAVAPLLLVWPLVFLFMAGLIRDLRIVPALFKTFMIATVIASLMGMALVIEAIGLGFDGLKESLRWQGATSGVIEGSVGYRLYNMSTLVYALPFLMATLFLPKHVSVFQGRWRFFCWIAIILVVIAMLISGRRGFWFVGLLSPIIIGGLFLVCRMPLGGLIRRSVGVMVVGSIFFIAGLIYLEIDLALLTRYFISGFNLTSTSADVNTSVRYEQWVDLVGGWKDQPLWGAGQGVPAPSVIRNADLPWTYELSYVALLYQAGLLGIVGYSLAVFWTIGMSILMVRRSPELAGSFIPVLAGLIAFLIVNATNPYLAKFDYLWTLFLPLALLNPILLRQQRSNTASLAPQ